MRDWTSKQDTLGILGMQHHAFNQAVNVSPSAAQAH